VLSPECWDDKFLEYDIVGAAGLHIDGRQNLNGGFSLRSHKFQKTIALDETIEIFHPCDEVLCRLYRLYLIKKYGFKYAPDDVSERFAYELRQQYCKSFGFHNFHLQPFREHVLIRRWNAMGDLVSAEPIMEYYHKKGYEIVLDTLPEFMPIFFNHPYRVKHISEVDKRVKYAKIVELNMSYEAKPKQNILKTYYEFANITDGVMRNARLHVNQEPNQRLFQKCIAFHIDSTNLSHRDTHGVNWQFVVADLQRRGWLCIQIGKRTQDIIAPHFNTETKEMLMYFLKGCELVVGIDSGICQLSVALGVPTVILAGSVDLRLRYNDFSKIEVVRSPCPSGERWCYHESEGSITGKQCDFNQENPPCSLHDEWSTLKAINKLLPQ
jgi:ADP-heptose:LPS heptosyltransferase